MAEVVLLKLVGDSLGFEVVDQLLERWRSSGSVLGPCKIHQLLGILEIELLASFIGGSHGDTIKNDL